MKERNQLTDWVIHKIEQDYAEDIALLIGLQGHSTGDDRHGICFDYFVPVTERGNELAETFLIDGVGHDLYPRSWERLENSVQLDDMAILIDRAQILYARTEEDAERFRSLKRRLWENLNDADFVYGKALEYMDKATEIYRSLVFEEKSYRVRAEIGCIHEYLSRAVAVLNHTYTESPIYSRRQAAEAAADSRMYHCPEMTEVPDGFFEHAERLLQETDTEKQKELLLHLMKATRTFILDWAPVRMQEAAAEVDYHAFREWYQELSLSFRRIRYFCAQGMAEEAYVDALNLQQELLYIAQEFQVEEMNLLDAYDAEHLAQFSERANQIEDRIRAILAKHQVLLQSFESVEAFIAARNQQA